MQKQRFVIIGAGLAGGTAALTLRQEGFEGDVTLLGAESHPPYSRPPLSKGYMRGEERFEDQLVAAEEAYASQEIDLQRGARAVRIDTGSKLVELEGDERRPYDRLLVTPGGRNRRPAVQGIDLDGVLQLRTVGEADRIRAAARPGRRAVVVGMGFIGSEGTASPRQPCAEGAAVEGATA